MAHCAWESDPACHVCDHRLACHSDVASSKQPTLRAPTSFAPSPQNATRCCSPGTARWTCTSAEQPSPRQSTKQRLSSGVMRAQTAACCKAICSSTALSCCNRARKPLPVTAQSMSPCKPLAMLSGSYLGRAAFSASNFSHQCTHTHASDRHEGPRQASSIYRPTACCNSSTSTHCCAELCLRLQTPYLPAAQSSVMVVR